MSKYPKVRIQDWPIELTFRISISVLVICLTVLYPAITCPPARLGSITSHCLKSWINILSTRFVTISTILCKIDVVNGFSIPQTYLCHHIHYRCSKIEYVWVFMAIAKVNNTKHIVVFTNLVLFTLFIFCNLLHNRQISPVLIVLRQAKH